MQQPSSFSRRRAAAIIAGGFTASASAASYVAPSVAATAVSAWNARAGTAIVADVLTSLSNVRQARGLTARAEAFDRFKRALELYEFTETSAAIAAETERDRPATLYRPRNPGSMLTAVIVRELDARPRTDSGWMSRFGDLETAIRTRVGIT